MKRKNTQTKDYKSIKYIQKQLLKFNDPKLTNAVTNAFNLIAKYKEPDGCLSTSVELYVALKYLGYEPKLCYGLVFLPNAEEEKHEIYHAWLELDGRVIDIAIYGNAKFSPYSFFDVETPICYEEYENISTIADYHPFEFDDDWKDAMLNKAVGKKITDYCDGSYRAVIWDFICDFLSIPHTEDNKLKLRSIVKGEVI